jgi:hypothetical protein
MLRSLNNQRNNSVERFIVIIGGQIYNAFSI